MGDIPDLGKEVEKLIEAISGGGFGTSIISSEEFFALDLEKIEYLKECLRFDEVRIVAVVRRPDDLLLSIYNQNAKTPSNDFAWPIETFLDDPKKLSPDMDTCSCIRRWITVFGPSSVNVARYEDADPVNFVLGVAGAPDILGQLPTSINASVPGAVIQIIRSAKMAGIEPPLRREIFKKASRLFADQPKLSLSTEQRRAVVRRYQDEYEELSEILGWENLYKESSIKETEDEINHRAPVYWAMKLIESMLKENH